MHLVCCGSASARDSGAQGDGGVCDLSLQLCSFADDVAVVLKIVCVPELVSRRWHIGRGRVNRCGPNKERWHVCDVRVDCISAAVLIPRAQLLPIGKRFRRSIRHTSLLNESCRSLVDIGWSGLRILCVCPGEKTFRDVVSTVVRTDSLGSCWSLCPKQLGADESVEGRYGFYRTCSPNSAS